VKCPTHRASRVVSGPRSRLSRSRASQNRPSTVLESAGHCGGVSVDWLILHPIGWTKALPIAPADKLRARAPPRRPLNLDRQGLTHFDFYPTSFSFFSLRLLSFSQRTSGWWRQVLRSFSHWTKRARHKQGQGKQSKARAESYDARAQVARILSLVSRAAWRKPHNYTAKHHLRAWIGTG